MKIALTGGTGFIGSHFLSLALEAGHSVVAFRRTQASKPLITMQKQPIWLNRQLEEVKTKDLDGCDVLVHLATHSGNVPYDNILGCMRWNLMAALELFDQARLAGIGKFVVAGSCFEYGRSSERYCNIPTDAPLEPTNSYAASKAAASIAFLQWAEEHHIHLEILRVFHVFGEGELQTRFWPSLRKAALSGADYPMTLGEQVRDFIPVEDVATIFMSRTLQDQVTGSFSSVYNIGTGKPCRLIDFAANWWKIWNAQGKIIPGAIPYRKWEVMRFAPGPNLLIP